jgi:tetratricopeptide (TPR) repeat protein
MLANAAAPGLLLPGVAQAQGKDAARPAADRARARDLYRDGTERFRRGEVAPALEAFQEAYRLDPHPVLAYNIARAHETLGQVEEAIASFRLYLELDPQASDRGAVEQRIATLEADVDARRALERRNDELAREAARPRDTAPPPPPPREPSAVPWVIAGVGVLGVGAGAVLGTLASGKRADAEDEPIATRAAELDGDASSLATAANVAFIAGGTVAAVGVVLGIIDLRRSSVAAGRTRPGVRMAAGPGSVWLRGRF